MTDRRLQRMQWAVRATLTLGVAASVTANILHARSNPISQAIAAWPPMALLITVELVTRVPVHRRSLGVIRVVAASTIAAIAAWISYHHMVGVVARYGETGTVPYLLPLSVDGLIIVASVSLVELAARRRDTNPPAGPSPAEAAAPDSVEHIRDTNSDIPPRNTERPEGDHESADDGAGQELDTESHDDELPDELDETDGDLAPDLVLLLPAARTARDDLIREGQPVSRDSLARRIRQNGHTIRNSAVSEVLAALRQETRSTNDSRPTAPI